MEAACAEERKLIRHWEHRDGYRAAFHWGRLDLLMELQAELKPRDAQPEGRR
ncbi:MAG: hypothetical protein QOE70_4352 [Chthoniobacter sp.]|nr:hypothetical protein [Chthoniobacter sp.]